MPRIAEELELASFDAAKKYAPCGVIHGGAANMWRDAWVLRWNYHLLAAPGYALLLTDYAGAAIFAGETPPAFTSLISAPLVPSPSAPIPTGARNSPSPSRGGTAAARSRARVRSPTPGDRPRERR